MQYTFDYYMDMVWDLLALKGVSALDLFNECPRSKINVFYKDAILNYAYDVLDISNFDDIVLEYEKVKSDIKEYVTSKLKGEFFQLVDEYLQSQSKTENNLPQSQIKDEEDGKDKEVIAEAGIRWLK